MDDSKAAAQTSGAPARNRGHSAMLAVALIAALAFPAAASATDFTFYGSGFGHGVGASQWGMFGLAGKKWGHRRILRYYYRNTTVGPAPSQPARLRVGLVQGRERVRLTATDGPVRLRVGSPSGSVAGTIPENQTWTVSAASERYEIRDHNQNIVGGRLWGGVDRHLFADYAASGASLFVQEAGHTYNRGTIEFNLYAACEGCAAEAVRLVARVSVQAYLYGIAEVPSGWPARALRAQAVASRTYALEKVARLGQNRPVCNCGLYASVFDQVYAGGDKEGGEQGARWVAAVDATAGETVLFEGSLIQAFFFAASGGYTESSEGAFTEALPYARARCDIGDFTASNPYNAWTAGPLTAAEVTAKLRPDTGDIGTVQRFADPVIGASGRIATIAVEGSTGVAVIKGTVLRRALGLRSTRLSVNVNRNVTGAIRTKYDKLRCAPGVARTRATSIKGGLRQRFERGAIYYNRARALASWLHGPTYAKYRALKEAGGILGLPRSDVVTLTRPRGCRSQTCTRGRFERGAIYHKEAVGTHELHGVVLAHYLARGGPRSDLRFPTSDVITAASGATSATFEGGRIRCSASGACRG